MSTDKSIDLSKLEQVSLSDIQLVGPNAPNKAYRETSSGLCVQIWGGATPGCVGTPWENTLRVAISRTAAKSQVQALMREYSVPLSWDDIQAIKDHLWPKRIAIEIYPPKEKIVNVADLRWIWVLPQGAVLPFNLEATSPHRLES